MKNTTEMIIVMVKRIVVAVLGVVLLSASCRSAEEFMTLTLVWLVSFVGLIVLKMNEKEEKRKMEMAKGRA